MILFELRQWTAALDFSMREIQKVGRPLREMIKNVRGVEDRRALLFRLSSKETQEALPCKQVQVRRNLIKDVDLLLFRKAFQQLASSSLTVADGVDVPSGVDLHDINELLHTRCIEKLLTNELRNCDVEEEICSPPVATIHAIQIQGRVVKDRLPQNLAITSWDHLFPAHDGEKGGLAGSIASDYQHTAALLKAAADINQLRCAEGSVMNGGTSTVAVSQLVTLEGRCLVLLRVDHRHIRNSVA
mmetsp:Transcript_55455/g.104160  ORF Transcript_55455/g.104160 Transcript_55455/m.104160 type:complete len:244 (-) Transcript_55455:52-783(-)